MVFHYWVPIDKHWSPQFVPFNFKPWCIIACQILVIISQIFLNWIDLWLGLGFCSTQVTRDLDSGSAVSTLVIDSYARYNIISKSSDSVMEWSFSQVDIVIDWYCLYGLHQLWLWALSSVLNFSTKPKWFTDQSCKEFDDLLGASKIHIYHCL